VSAVTVRPLVADDIEVAAGIVAHAFNRSASAMAASIAAAPPDEFRVAEAGGVPVGVLRAVPVGQYHGGRAVPAVDVRQVAVAAHARGGGVVRRLLEETLAEQRHRGVGIAVLLPSSVAAYRRLGFEVAGAWTKHEVPVAALGAAPAAGIEPWSDEGFEEVAACYAAFARLHNGLLDRTPAWWQEFVLVASQSNPRHRYLCRVGGEVRGYVVYSQPRVEADIAYHYALEVHDMAWLDEHAAANILAFLAGHRALATSVRWIGPPQDPLRIFVDVDDARPAAVRHWMARFVDPVVAFEARGYPPSADADIGLRIEARSGETTALTISVGGGRARVAEGATNGSTVSAGALAAMFTGWLQPVDAVRTGSLRPARDADVDALAAILAGPTPWTLDWL
jgi:predicted acetyltransferase